MDRVSAYLDLHIDRGTTYRFQFQYGFDTDGEFIPYDLDGATAEMFIRGGPVGEASIEDDTVSIHLSPEETSTMDAPYEVFITFASGDVKKPLRGTVFIS